MRSKLSSRSESSVRTRGCTQLERHVPAYREYLLGRGNAAGYVRSCEAAVMHLSMWMHQTNLGLADVDETLVVEFLKGIFPNATARRVRVTQLACALHWPTFWSCCARPVSSGPSHRTRRQSGRSCVATTST